MMATLNAVIADLRKARSSRDDRLALILSDVVESMQAATS